MEPGTSSIDQIFSISSKKKEINGNFLITDEYYKKSDSKIIMSEITSHVRDIVSLNNLRFNSVASCRLHSSDNVLKHVILNLTLSSPPTYVSGNRRLILPQFWGFHCIRRLNFTFPNSNQTLSLNGSALFYEIYMKSQTMERFHDILNKSGEYQEQSISIDSSPNFYENNKLEKWSQKEAKASILIDLCVLQNMKCSKGVPIDISTSSVIDLNIEFKAAKEIIMNYTENLYPPSGFESGNLILHTIKFTDNSNSIKYDLLKSNDEKVHYTIPYYQIRNASNFTKIFKLTSPKYLYDTFTFNISSIEFSDLISIIIRVVPVKTYDGSSSISPFFCSSIEHVKLSNAGSDLINIKGRQTIELMNILQNGREGCSQLNLPYYNTIPSDNLILGNERPLQMKDSQPLIINLSSNNPFLCKNMIQNTMKYSSSELSVSLDVVADYTELNTDYEYLFETFLVYPASLTYSGMSSEVHLL